MTYAPPCVRALYIAERGVQHDNAFELCAKPRAALATHPKCQRDFWNEHDGRLAARERVLYRAQVHFRLATSCDAMKQLNAEFTEFEPPANCVERRFLRF